VRLAARAQALGSASICGAVRREPSVFAAENRLFSLVEVLQDTAEIAVGGRTFMRLERAPNAAKAGIVRSPIQMHLEAIYTRYEESSEGTVAAYIPELAKANPDWFAICLATNDGHLYEIGDSDQSFTLQSISKPFVYGLALEDLGREAVLRRIGVEPTGDAFNAISLESGSGRPLNPMINAGAIAASSLIAARSAADARARLLAVLSAYAGRPLAVDDAVYESERATGHRNRAIGHMLRNFEIVTEDPESALDLYFRQCSVAVTCRDLALMAATLANGGVHPLSGERAVREDVVADVLSVMTTCGMYDFAGEWVYSVGMPAKSGVGGGILAVLPGQLGIGVFSPRLDGRGNSVRGVAVCRDLSREFGLHFLRATRLSRSVIRSTYGLASVRSKMRRPQGERALLDSVGDRAAVYELQGDLVFCTAEAVVRRITERCEDFDLALLDVQRVQRTDASATRILVDLCLEARAGDKVLLFVGAERFPGFLRAIEEALAERGVAARGLNFTDLDPALEWCEEGLLRRYGAGSATGAAAAAFASQEICRGLDEVGVAALEALVVRKRFAPGEIVVRAGEVADAMYFLLDGRVSVLVHRETGEPQRLTTLSAGMAFGELALVTRSRRSADVRADTVADCYVLSADAFEKLGATLPAVKMTLLENMLRHALEVVARLNQEVAVRQL
jgi:glutaminase